jgi:uncharacterized secreted protein with C-terminal beta-propeller domain
VKPILKCLPLCLSIAIRFAIPLTIPFMIVACGGSNNIDKPKKEFDYTSLAETRLEPGPLRQASSEELSRLVKNGLRISLNKNNSLEAVVMTNSVNATTADVSKNLAAGKFSGTNVQVSGVDEADNVKYDGKYIFVATPLEYTEKGSQSRLKIFETNPEAATASEISNTLLDTSRWANISELYLVGSAETTAEIATIRRSWNNIFMASALSESISTDFAAPWYYQPDNGIELSLYDVRTPTTPTKTWTLSLDGDLLASRKVGNRLYLVSSFVPTIPNLYFNTETNEKRVSNETIIKDAPIEKLLPEYSIDGGAPQPLVKNSGCYIPADTKPNYGHLNLVNITTIDLSTHKLIESVCINGNVAGVYSTPENLYVGASDYRGLNEWNGFTVVHKFALVATGAAYVATGLVEGVLGWSQPSFRMDEYQDNLRIVTSSYTNFVSPVHHLSVLKKVNNRSELEVIARLPNTAQPEPIGKPREEIYSVRFDGDRAYIVTFERKDPLYVLDLSNPVAPKIAGQLEIPGFSTYLHPVGKNYLFSLGNETDENGRPSGVKVALFDVGDMSKPQLVSKHVFGNAVSWTEALYDAHALSFLQVTDDQLRIALPITLYEDVKNQNQDILSYRWLNTSLYLFEINGLANNSALLEKVGQVVGEDNTKREYPAWTANDRGILHDDAVFYVHGSNVAASAWKFLK